MEKSQGLLSRYKVAMKALGLLYFVGAIVFFFFHKLLFETLNQIPHRYGFLEPSPQSCEFFWLALTTSMMVMLTVLCFLSAATPRIKGYPLVHLVSKLTSTFGFLCFLIFHQPYVTYLAGVITDLPIALLMIYFMKRLGKEIGWSNDSEMA